MPRADFSSLFAKHACSEPMYLIVSITVVNLGLGFGLAKFFGRGPALPSRMALWTLFTDTVSSVRGRFVSKFRRSAPAVQPESKAAEPADNTSPPPAAVKTPQPVDEADGEVLDASAEDLLEGLKQFRAQISGLDTKVRQCSKNSETREIQACVREFQEANAQYLNHSEETAERLKQQEHEGAESSKISDQMLDAIARQTEHVRTTATELEAIDVENNPQAGCGKLLAETNHLASANSQLTGELTAARIEVARQQGHLEDLDDEMLIDELTGIPNRVALEATLESFWNAETTSEQTLTVAMCDIDRCDDLNGQSGVEVIDRLIQAVAGEIIRALEGEEFAARYQGQRFAILYPGREPSEATERVEAIRQMLEVTNFQSDEGAVQVTMSCAVNRTQDDDTSESLFARCNATLQEAKRYGRNRTFMHEGKYPAPIVPPSLEIPPREIQI